MKHEDDWSEAERALMDDMAFIENPEAADSNLRGQPAQSRSGGPSNDSSNDSSKGRSGLDELKAILGSALRSPERLQRPDGAPTGVESFDERLLWGGFPKGEMTLLWGEMGTGATSLWIEAASGALQRHQWAAWIEGEAPLCPTPLRQRGANLARLLVARAAPAETPAEQANAWLKLTSELLNSTLFEVIGSGATIALRLRESQARQLLSACRSANSALILVARGPPPPFRELFALIVRFEKQRTVVERALHRSPFELPRRISYATFSQHLRLDGSGVGPLAAPADDANARARALPQLPNPRPNQRS